MTRNILVRWRNNSILNFFTGRVIAVGMFKQGFIIIRNDTNETSYVSKQTYKKMWTFKD